MNDGRYIGISATTDTYISVLPIWAISVDTDMPTLVATLSENTVECLFHLNNKGVGRQTFQATPSTYWQTKG